MAKIVLKQATPHGPMLSTPPVNGISALELT